MKRVLLVMAVGLVMAAVVVAMSMPALAAINDRPGKGNPDTTPSGKCPPGQNQDTSPGGLKKCG